MKTNWVAILFQISGLVIVAANLGLAPAVGIFFLLLGHRTELILNLIEKPENKTEEPEDKS